MLYGLIGEHLQHSFSVEVHKLIAEYDYQLIEVSPDELTDFLARRDFRGLNVTIPYKQKVIPLLDHISDEAHRIGAVNTVVNRDGELWGYNTDCYGFSEWASHLDLDFKGRKVLILGRGGAAKAVSVAANDAGASFVTMTGRDTDMSTQLQGRDYDCIVNATPVGMFPDIFAQPLLDLGELNHLTYFLDCIYNPLRTLAVMDAKSRGVVSDGGLYMLVAQAVKSASLFLDRDFDISLTDSVYDKILKSKENLVFIGMPTCGKTTLGRKIANERGMEFFDTDEMIVSKTGRSIQDIFSEFGEEYFRKLESETVREVSSRQNCVIATGGGVILDPQNIANLKCNGHLYYIYKEISDLEIGLGRPLLKDYDSLRKMWEERHSLYLKYCDEIFAL